MLYLSSTVALGALLAPTSPMRTSRSASRALRCAAPIAAEMETSRFLDRETTLAIREEFGSPLFVYDAASLRQQAETALSFPHAYGVTVRFAMKALPNAAVLQLFNRLGLHIDASSGYEVRRAVAAGLPASHISLSSQECPTDLAELLALGIKFNACSLKQLEQASLARKSRPQVSPALLVPHMRFATPPPLH